MSMFKFFTECSGPCVLCACDGDCLAGHGDDYFSLASKEQLGERYREKRCRKEDLERIAHELLTTYGYDIHKEEPENDG